MVNFMNTVNNANLLSLLLNLGPAVDGAGPALDLDSALQMSKPLDPEALPPDLLAQLSEGSGELDFTALMQQGMASPQVELEPESSPELDGIAFVFKGMEEMDPTDTDTVDMPAIEQGLADLQSEAEASKAADATDPELQQAQLPASPVIPADYLPASDRIRSGKPSVRIEGSAIRAEARSPGYREALLDGGETLPGGRQALAETGDAEAEQEGVLRAEAEAGKYSSRPVQDVRGGPSGWNRTGLVEESGETVSTSSGSGEDSAEPVDEAFLEQLQRRRGGEAGSNQETQRSVMAEAPRNDAALPKAVAALAPASILRPATADNPGMNELPPEMKELQLSPRAGHAAWGREMGERIGFLLHNNLKQAEIRLDPPHLGKLEIQLQVQDDKALVHIQTQTAQTRDLMDASLLRLRDALQDAGYSQVDVQVSHREQSMGQGDGGTGGGFSGQASVEGPQESEILPTGMSRREIELTARLQGRIDYFA